MQNEFEPGEEQAGRLLSPAVYQFMFGNRAQDETFIVLPNVNAMMYTRGYDNVTSTLSEEERITRQGLLLMPEPLFEPQYYVHQENPSNKALIVRMNAFQLYGKETSDLESVRHDIAAIVERVQQPIMLILIFNHWPKEEGTVYFLRNVMQMSDRLRRFQIFVKLDFVMDRPKHYLIASHHVLSEEERQQLDTLQGLLKLPVCDTLFWSPMDRNKANTLRVERPKEDVQLVETDGRARIRHGDPIAKWLGCVPGDVVRIQRDARLYDHDSEMAPKTCVFRIVVAM